MLKKATITILPVVSLLTWLPNSGAGAGSRTMELPNTQVSGVALQPKQAAGKAGRALQKQDMDKVSAKARELYDLALKDASLVEKQLSPEVLNAIAAQEESSETELNLEQGNKLTLSVEKSGTDNIPSALRWKVSDSQGRELRNIEYSLTSKTPTRSVLIDSSDSNSIKGYEARYSNSKLVEYNEYTNGKLKGIAAKWDESGNPTVSWYSDEPVELFTVKSLNQVRAEKNIQ